MNKPVCAVLTCGLSLWMCAAVADVTYTLSCELPAFALETQTDGSVCPVSTDSSWWLGLDTPGAPAVPRRTYFLATPDGQSFASHDCTVEWETLAANVRLAPQPEAVRDGEASEPTPADPAAYDVEIYPAQPVVVGPSESLAGVTLVPVTVAPIRWNPRTGLLERARTLTLRATFVADAAAVSRPWSAAHRAQVQQTVVNPEAVAEPGARTTVRSKRTLSASLRLAASTDASSANVPDEPGLYRTNPTTNAYEYLLVSPPDFFDDWCWYVRERQKTHPSLRFAVKNTAAIYDAYPFGKDLAQRNAAESIHAYLRQAVSNGLQYVVLGGAWLDAQNLNNYTPYFATGEAMSLSNSVPGIYGFPREDWRQIPADLFYGCLDLNKDQTYPWDANGDGKYIDKADCQYNDTYPDVCVSRLTLNPHSGHGTPYNQHALITNYVAKLKRGEDRLFNGHYRYGMSVASTGSSKLRRTGDRMCYRELEFYDDMYNMFDPRHHDSLEDGEYSTRIRYFDQFSNWRPIRSVKGMMNYTWTETQPTLAAAMDDYYAGDRDFGYVQAHGWAQGAAQFSAYRFAIATGLTLFNGGSGPCETGYPDYHVTSGGRKVLQYNVGDAAVTNPDGGALASVNNSRWSWAGGGGGFAAMSYYMLNEMLIGFNGDRLDVGHAWLKGVRNYWPAGRWGNTAGWVLTEQFLYGDPLVRLPEVPNVWWQGGATGVWDKTTPNWTNSVDDTQTFDAASNVTFNVQSGLDLTVASEIAAMYLKIPVQDEAALVSFAGTGTLKVVQAVDVAGTDTTLKFDVAGGVGHAGIRFSDGAGNLVFEGTNKFYVAGVQNARSVALAGGGVTLDVDQFPAGTFPLVIDGSAQKSIPLPNELRASSAGGLCRFGSLAITNSYVKLATVDAFGNEAPSTHELVNSKLEIGANVYYQRSGFPEGLNATFRVGGASTLTSSEGGLWTVKHTTTFALDPGTDLTLGAETAAAGGKIVITNVVASSTQTNTVTIAHAAALAGDVTIGAGIHLVLKELPLAAVTSLTVGKGASIELPDDASGYWQIVPVSSKFNCADDVSFALASDPTNRLAGSASKTGSFFKEGALYRWTGQEGDLTTFFANRHPKILFGDIADASVVTVRVAAAVSPEFAFFANLKTKYVFESAATDASVLFSSVYFCGPTEFNVPVSATEYVEISTATSCFVQVTAPYVHVAAGAGLGLAGSHWTDFRFDDGAVLVAVPGETLDWNADTSLTFPEEGTVRVDVSRLEPLPTGLSPLIAGRAWTIPDLKDLSLVQSGVEFRLDGLTLAVASGDDLKGPYELSFADATNWNNAAWTAASNSFPKSWAACALDWSADAVVAIPTNRTANGTLTVDCDVHLNSLTVHAATNDFAILPAADAAVQPAFSVATLDLSDCHGMTDIAVDLGDARIVTSASTNGADIVHLRGSGSGTIEISGVTVLLDRPGDWSLTVGAQGVLKVIAPQAYERFRVAKVPSGFKDSALTVVVTDAEGHVIDGFDTLVADEALWCVPPALQAEVPPGTNELTRLEWHDVLGNVVSNIDWTSAAAGFQLIGSPTSGVVIAKDGFASVWSRLSVSNEVTIYGKETLEPSMIPGGNGVLALAGAFTVKADVNAAQTLLSGAKLKLHAGTTLEIRHRSINYDARNQDWRGITGTGRIVLADGVSSWMALPRQIFADTLSVETASDLVLTEGYVGNPLALRNLSGSGRFRADWSGGGTERPIRTVQTGVTAYSGYLHCNSGSRTATLVVASDDAVASTNKALILNGTAVENHALTIETNGCVILTGTWKGPIKVSGILVITNACATNGLSVALQNGGEVRLATPEELPALTAAPAYVEPTYPADPEPSDDPAAEAEDAVRILTACVGTKSASWSQLAWTDTNGAVVASVDWTIVTNVTLTATNGFSRVVLDADGFAGVAKLAGDLTVEVRRVTPFTLTADSAGAIEFRLDPEPTATCDLLKIAPAEEALVSRLLTNFSLRVLNRYGCALAAAGEVTFDATANKYALIVQDVNRPTYNCTFDTQYEDSITSPLWFSGSGNLTYKARPEFFVDSQAGRALLGTSMNHFAMHSHNGNPTVGMDGVNAWSFNFVVKLPTNNGGIIFGWGNKDSGSGVALARVSENVAGVYAWENGGGVRLVVSANVPFASTQYHAYAITHDSQTLSLYVDGVLAQSAPLVGKYPSRGFYQWFKMYGQNGGLSNGPTTEIDDFRLYLNVCLTPTSVKKIADDFPPWPTHPTAEVDVADLAWSDLYWSADCATDESITLVAGPGNLKFDSSVAVTNVLALTGGVVPLKLVGEGQLVVSNGLAVGSALEIDAAGLDGTRLASYAVANVPYSRWLVRGAYTGRVTVTALPDVPEGYDVRVEYLSNLGVRLLFTAPRYALAPALGLSIGPDSFDDEATATLGLHPTSPTNWYPYATWTNEATAVGGISVIGQAGGKVDSQAPYGSDTSVARYFYHTSFDGDSDAYNGRTNSLTLAGLKMRFGTYRVLVYFATDTDGANFGPVFIAGRTYGGLAAGSETESATVADFTGSAWGKAKVSAATEGVNVVVSDVLSADEITVAAQRLKIGNNYARAQIAAIEIVKVAEIHAFTGSRYTADVAETTDWDNGDGTGLAHHPDWRNNAFSSICLTAQVAEATLTFNTAVTAETFRIVTTADQKLTLQRAAEMSVYELDLSASEGTVSLAGDFHLGGTDGARCVLAAAPQGTLDIVVDNVTTNQRLLKLAAGFDCTVKGFAATVHDAKGDLPDESWTVLPLDGWLVLQRLDPQKPWYSLTFEKDFTTCVDGSTAPTLKEEGAAAYVESCGSHWALTGATPYSKDPMDYVPASWTIHAVAEMPKESNGILFGYGCYGQRGVGLVTVDANNVAVAWWDSRGRFTVITAPVTNATCQFHAYALVSTGTQVALFVDGDLKGSADVAVNPTSPVIQIGSICGGCVSGFTKTTTGALDDWRLYDGVLSANAIGTLAAEFPPWPEYRTATLAADATPWDDLVWAGDAVEGRPLLLESLGGSLAVTNACPLTNALYATGQTLVLKMGDAGVFEADAELTLLAGWTIDCSDLDATNLMNQADQQSPYVHWLVRGAYTGDDPTVTGVPEVSERYSLVVVTDATQGVWLAITRRSDYVANLTNTTVWANGAGDGLERLSITWANDVTSTLTLTQLVDAATLTFDTSVTGRLFKVVSTNSQELTIQRDEVDLALANYDLTEACGAVTLAQDISSDTTLDLGPETIFAGDMNGTIETAPAGASVRYAKTGATLLAAQLKAGVTNTFAAATVKGDLYNNPRLYCVRAGDQLTLCPSGGSGLNHQFAGDLVVAGGSLLLDSQNASDRFWFGVCGRSSLTQTGGSVVANAKSESTSNNGCFLFGVSGSGNIPVTISGGTFSVVDSPVCFWQDANLSFTVGGTGFAKVKGLWGNNGKKGIVTVKEEGVLSVGSKGIAANLKSLTLAGGTLTAHADALTAMAIALSGDATIAADAGFTHTVSGAITGSGKLTVGATNRTGTVRFADAAVLDRDLVLVGGVLDVGTNRLTHAIERTGGQIQIQLTADEEQQLTKLPILPISVGTTNANYIVLDSAGSEVYPEWITIEDGQLTVDTSGMDFSTYQAPFHGTQTADAAWAKQTWYDSSTPAKRVPAAYWGSGAIVLTGDSTLQATGTGSIILTAGLTVDSSLTIDAHGVDGTNIAQYAVAGAPYSHWILKGTVTGTVVVTNLPAMPATYAVAAEVLPAEGVRLVVTANRAARFGAISINIAGNDKTVAADAGDQGAYPIAGAAWNNFRPNTTTKETTLKMSLEDDSVTNRTDISYLNHQIREYDTKKSESLPILYGYHDDGVPSEFTITGIPFDQYRLIVYYATDSADFGFAPLAAGVTSASVKSYTGGTFLTAAGGTTHAGSSNWGTSNVRTALVEGVNYLVTDVLSGGSAYLKSYRKNSDKGRATIAAIQVVKVGALYEGAPEYDEKQLASCLSYPLPGTSVTQDYTYVYHPLGDDDGTWEKASNWATAAVWLRKTGAIETNYTAYTGSKGPALSDAYVPLAIVGRAVTVANLEGWNARYGLYEGARLTVQSQTKFQSDANTSMFVAVDATSQMKIQGLGKGNFEGHVDFYVAAPSGIVFEVNYNRGAVLDYHLVGAGSVAFPAGFSGTQHTLKSATIELGDVRWTAKAKAKKYLVIGSNSVVTKDAAVAGGVTRTDGDAALEETDAVGTYRLGSDETGTYIEWMARAMPDVLEVHPSETGELIPMDAVDAVKIVCVVTNDSVETKVDLTGAFQLAVTAAGVQAVLDPQGKVSVPKIGTLPAEEVSVTPELTTITSDDHVAETPFVLTDDGAAVGVKAIPGLVYRLMRARSLSDVRTEKAEEAACVRSEGSRLKLVDSARPDGAAFYIIRVSP